jgi:hypothetical protein
MGKAKLRSQLAKELKDAGISRKLYYGSGRVAKRYYSGAHLRYLLFMISTIGEVVQDCDGFNHRVKKPIVERLREGRNSKVIFFDRLEFDDGKWSCGCPAGVDYPLSREEIERYWLAWCKDPIGKEYWADFIDKIEPILSSGGHICDENGLLLAEFEQK